MRAQSSMIIECNTNHSSSRKSNTIHCDVFEAVDRFPCAARSGGTAVRTINGLAARTCSSVRPPNWLALARCTA
jgi:hypothetical protein